MADDWYRAIAFTGWIGVDLFFVLSGFLITGILLRTRRASNYFRVFYARRSLRIFPLYYAFLAGLLFVVLPLGGRVGPLGPAVANISDLREHQSWFWLYASNIYTFIHGGEKAVAGMGHFWSLAIEEQYYLLWSPLVFLLNAKKLAWVCIGLILTVTIYRVWGVLHGMPLYTAATFTLTRVDSLVYGSLAACLLHMGLPKRWCSLMRRMTVPLWIAAIGLQIVMGSSMDAWVGSVMVSPAIFAGVFMVTVLGVASAEEGAGGGLLTNKWLCHLGTISYGLYVFHVPIRGALLPIYERFVPQTLVGGSQLHWTIGFALIGFTLSFLIAQASWWLFESRILIFKQFFQYRFEEGRERA